MNSISANEIIQLLGHAWAGTKDIMKIGSVGEATALKIKKEIREKMRASLPEEERHKKYYTPRNMVPMEEVMNYFRINVDYFSKMAKKGKINNE